MINIQFVWTDSNGVESNSGFFCAPNWFQTQEWSVPAGEYITKLEINSGWLIDGITFITDKEEDQEFAQTKKSLLISHLIFESMQKLHDILFFYFLDRGTYF
jgi:hypothetical protein